MLAHDLALNVLVGKIKKREFQKIFLSFYTLFLYIPLNASKQQVWQTAQKHILLSVITRYQRILKVMQVTMIQDINLDLHHTNLISQFIIRNVCLVKKNFPQILYKSGCNILVSMDLWIFPTFNLPSHNFSTENNYSHIDLRVYFRTYIF